MKTPTAGINRQVSSAGILRGARRVLKYLLGPFRFSTDQAAPLASPYTEAGAVGSLTVTDTGSAISVSGGRAVYATTASNTMLASGVLARVIGRAILAKMRPLAGRNRLIFFAGVTIGFDTQPFIYDGGTAISGPWSPTNGVDTQMALVLRSTGAFYFEAVTGATYRLLWVGNAGSVATGDVEHQILTGASGQLDDLRVVDLGTYDSRFLTDFGLALNRSTFTAADATALTAIVPESGGAWTQNIGTFSIISNKVKVATIGATQAIATVDAGAADVLAEVTYNTATTFDCVLLVRYSAADNSCWMVQLTVNSFILFEYDGTTFTSRASATSLTNTTGTDYRIVVVAEGSTISAYLNNANKISYASATRNQTLTKHGIRGSSTTSGGTWDTFIVWPRTLSLPAGI